MLDARLAAIASSVFRVPMEELAPETAIGTIEAWDSLGHLQLILEIEGEFGLRFRTERISKLRSLREIQEEVEALGGRSDRSRLGLGRTGGRPGGPVLYGSEDGSVGYGEVVAALLEVGINRGDAVFIHSEISAFGRVTLSGERLMQAIIEAFKETIGPDGLIIMPTFSYSFCRNEVYDRARTPSTVGVLTEAFRQMPDVVRTVHPIFSAAVWGRGKEMFLRGFSRDSFDANSIFGSVHRHRGKLLFFGASFQACTFLHYIEQMHGIPYRYMKTFTGRIREGLEEYEDSYTYFVRYLDMDVELDTSRLEKHLLERGLMKEVGLGSGRILTVESTVLFDEVSRLLDQDVYYLLRREPKPLRREPK